MVWNILSKKTKKYLLSPTVMKNHAKGFLDLVSDALTEVPEVDVFEVKSKIENGQDICLIDVREDHEWIESKIPTSIHIGKGVIERDIESIVPQKEKEIIERD